MCSTGVDQDETQPLTKAEVDRKITDLRKHRIAGRTVRDDLSAPVDEDVRVDESPGTTKLVLVADGVDVSWATVVHFEQQIGGSTVRMGGIAEVGTHDQHRFKGYSTRVLENSLCWMRQNGFHTSMLYGIPSYYPKFGYAKAFPTVTFNMAVRDAESASAADYTFSPFVPTLHLSAVLRMYRLANERSTGVNRRLKKHWRIFQRGLSWNSSAIVEMVLDKNAKPVGYIAFDDRGQAANVIEVGYTTPKVFSAFLRRAAEFAWQQRLERIQFHLPEDLAFTIYCRGFGLRMENTFPADGGGMVRLIHVPGAFQAVKDELAQRVRRHGALTIRTNLDDVSLTWADGDMEVSSPVPSYPSVRLPQWALAQMLYGYLNTDALRATGVLRGTAATCKILDQLLPVHPHYHYAADHF
ncbi:MAG: GNAT family N-acetyltransferase [Lentisphaeria bacterium]|nr:GNAT family N-acetyltransferase [Lentisphaeria bacterium]